jgi:hypothetical protein
MSNQRMAGDNDIFRQAQEMSRKFEQEQARIKSVMDRQTRRDVAAARGEVIPFSQADIL